MKKIELQEMLKEILMEELEDRDGYSNDYQRAFAHSQATTPRHDDTKKAEELAKSGKYVVTVKDDVHCKTTDAVLGQCVSIHKVFDKIEDAEKEADKLYNSGMDVGLITPKSVNKEVEPPKYSSEDDKIPFEESGFNVNNMLAKLKSRRDPEGIEEAKQIQDPTKEEMMEFLRVQFGREEGFEYDAEAAIYWFANFNHGGQTSNLYSALSTSEFSPGPIARGPQPGSSEEISVDEVNHIKNDRGDTVIASGAPGSVIRFADQHPTLIQQMKEWAKDCSWADLTADDIDELEPEEILRGVQNNYEGGIRQFIKDSEQPTAEVPVGYKEGYGMGDMSKDKKRAFKGARWTVKFNEEKIKISEVKNVIKELVNEMWMGWEESKTKPINEESGWNPKPLPKDVDAISKLIFGLSEGMGMFLSYDNQTGHSSDWIYVKCVAGGNELIYVVERGPHPEGVQEIEDEDEVVELSKEATTGGYHYYNIEPIQDYKKSNYRDEDPTGQDDDVEYPPDQMEPQFESVRKLYEAKGKTEKDKLRSIVRETLREALGATNPAYEKWLDNSALQVCPKCGNVDKGGDVATLNPSNPTINQCKKCQHKWNPDNTPKKRHVISQPKKDTGTGEWVVKWMTDGKRDENKTYYTDDRQDAIDTAAQMFKHAEELNKTGK